MKGDVIRLFLNPFFLYLLTWLGVVFLYNLKIANLYPNLSIELVVFIFFSIFISLLLAILYDKILVNRNFLNAIGKNYSIIYLFIFVYFIIEFSYVGKVPLIEILLKTGYNYLNFKGIKTLHVIIFTYNFYITLCAFNDFLFTKQKKYLFYSILGLFPYVLLYSRGPILMLLACTLFIWLFYKYNLKTILKILFLGTFMLYIFGISGNIRHYYNWNNTNLIKNMVQIETKENILDPFFWSYVYITSPLGNLQYNINENKPNYELKTFFFENLLPDAVSKRVEYKKNYPKLMIDTLTVSTAYINSYLSYGNFGMYLAFFIYMFCEILYFMILKKTKYYILGVGLISLLNIFSIFSNMFVFSGFSFSLVYPLIDIINDKIKNKYKKER